MLRERSDCPDWRDEAAYLPLLAADRSLIAWEWLRRDPAYCEVARQSSTQRRVRSEHFGLVAFEPPELGVPLARPLWTVSVCPSVLIADGAGGAGSYDLFDLARLAQFARLLGSGDCEHLLLSDGLRAVRVDGRFGTFSNGPVSLSFTLRGVLAAEAPLLTLKRLIALSRRERFLNLLHPAETRARRWVLMLRAADAVAAGASQRDIAQVLLGRPTNGPGWRETDPSLRAQVQRLVRAARGFAAGGYFSLLK